MTGWLVAFACWSALFVLTGDGPDLFIALACAWLAGRKLLKIKGSE